MAKAQIETMNPRKGNNETWKGLTSRETFAYPSFESARGRFDNFLALGSAASPMGGVISLLLIRGILTLFYIHRRIMILLSHALWPQEEEVGENHLHDHRHLRHAATTGSPLSGMSQVSAQGR